MYIIGAVTEGVGSSLRWVACSEGLARQASQVPTSWDPDQGRAYLSVNIAIPSAPYACSTQLHYADLANALGAIPGSDPEG
jgi:hypothetical protein